MSVDCELHKWMKKFCRVRRTEPMKLVIDGFSSEFCLVFDFEDNPEDPASVETCDVLIERLPQLCDAGDYVASRMRLVTNADKPSVMRLLAALRVRFHEVVREIWQKP